MTDEYDDIIDLPHHVSQRHAPMPLEARAAQFAPFAALTGYDAAIKDAIQQNEESYEAKNNDDDVY